MSIINERRLAALTRVYTLCTANPLPAGLETAPPGFATQVAALKSSITNATSLATAQGSGLRVTAHSTRERQALRRALRDQQLLPLSQAARALEQTHPGLAKHFQIPFSNAREAQLLAAATAMAGETSKPEFTPLFSAQLGADFLDRLNGAIQAITASGATNETGRRGHIAATTGVNTALTAGRKAVQYLLATVRACCSTLAKTDAVAAAQTLRRFETAARVERPAKVAKAVAQAQSSITSRAATPVVSIGKGQIPAAAPASETTSAQPVATNNAETSLPIPASRLQAAA